MVQANSHFPVILMAGLDNWVLLLACSSITLLLNCTMTILLLSFDGMRVMFSRARILCSLFGAIHSLIMFSAIPTVEAAEAVASATIYTSQLKNLLKFEYFTLQISNLFHRELQNNCYRLKHSEAQYVPQTFWFPGSARSPGPSRELTALLHSW